MEDLRNKFDVEAPRCRGAYLEDAPPEIWVHKDWIIEPKMDGVRITMQIGKHCSLLVGRNRQDFLKGVARAKHFRSQNHVNPFLSAIACTEQSGTILDGELTDTCDLRGEYTKDTIRRMEQGEKIGYVVWGVLFYKGQDVRDLPDSQRRSMAKKAIDDIKRSNEKNSYANNIRLIDRFCATLEKLEHLMSTELEGVIAKDKTKPIPRDKSGKFQRTNTWWWKIKGDERRTVDAFIIGVTGAMDGGSGVNDIARKPNGKAATFTMAMATKILKHGWEEVEVAKMSNLPELAVEQGFFNFEMFKYRVAEMQVSGWDGERFRWPRFVKWRPDKTPNDCLFGEQVGGAKT